MYTKNDFMPKSYANVRIEMAGKEERERNREREHQRRNE